MTRLLLILPLVLLAACESEHTKQWYMDNDEARHERVRECKNDYAKMSTDCLNAIDAQSHIVVFGK